jgi:hypothetical protein
MTPGRAEWRALMREARADVLVRCARDGKVAVAFVRDQEGGHRIYYNPGHTHTVEVFDYGGERRRYRPEVEDALDRVGRRASLKPLEVVVASIPHHHKKRRSQREWENWLDYLSAGGDPASADLRQLVAD